MPDGKVTIDVELNDSTVAGQVSKVKRKLDDLSGKDATINVKADTSSAKTALEDIGKKADDVEGNDPTINVKADTSSAKTALDDVSAKADDVDGNDPTITATADVSGAKSALDDLDSYIEGKASSWNSILSGIGQGIGQSILNGAKGIVSSGISAIFSGGMGYETGLAKVATMLPEGHDMATLGEQFLALSTQYGVDVTDIEEAAYNALSSGVGIGENNQGLLSYLEQYMKVGTGGFTDTNSAVAAASAYLNTYGLDPSDPANQSRIANILLKTQNKGITTVGEQASAISNATVLGAANSVSPEQIGAMVATATAQMGQGKTAEATTGVKQLISELSKSGTEAQKNMTAALEGTAYSGMTFKDAMEAGANMVDILKAMNDYAIKNDSSLSDMFSSVESGNMALLLLNNEGETFLDNLEYMYDDTDAVTYAYETMADTTATSIDKIAASMSKFAINLFEALSPSIQKFLDVLNSEEFKAALQNLSDKFAEWMDSEGAVAVVDSVTSAIQTLLDLLSGETTIGDVLWNALSSFFDKVGEFFGRMTIDLINAIIDAIPILSKYADHLDYDTIFGDKEPEQTSTYSALPLWMALFNPTGYAGQWAGATLANSLFGSDASKITEFGNVGASGLSEDQRRALEDTMQDVVDEAITKSTVDRVTSMIEEQVGGQQEVVDIPLENLDSATTAAIEGANNMSDASEAIDSTLNDTASSLESASSSASKAASASSALKAAMLALSIKLRGIKISTSTSTGNSVLTATDGTHAVGLDTVPFDGYRAILHAGEMVLNAPEASALRLARESAALSGGTSIDYAQLARAMSNIGIDMDGQRVGRLVERGVSRQQYNRSVSYNRANPNG